jgi:uridine kinase
LLKQYLLNPLSPGGNRRYCVAAFNHVTDLPVPLVEQEALPASILLFDGIFLHRPELRSDWDPSIFLRANFDVPIARYAARDGISPNPLAESNYRYVEGQRIYLNRCSPEAYATLVIDNNDLTAPFVVAKL